MTWDEIYDNAIDTGFGDPKLKAKDEAWWNVRNLMMEFGCDDLNEAECAEDKVEDYCDALQIQFDDCGNIVSISLPAYLKDYIKFEYR